MKKKLSVNIVDSLLMSKIINMMDTNDICIDKNVSLRILKSEVKEFPENKFRKPSLEIKFRNFTRDTVKKVVCKIIIKFKGKGGICYQVKVVGSISATANKDQISLLETCTYAFLKAYLENDIILSGLYPEGLIYPDSSKITGINIMANEKGESKGTMSSKSTIKVDADQLFIKVIKDENSDISPSYTEEDEIRYNQRIQAIRRGSQLTN